MVITLSFIFNLDQWFSTGVPRYTIVPRDPLGVPREMSDICDYLLVKNY